MPVLQKLSALGFVTALVLLGGGAQQPALANAPISEQGMLESGDAVLDDGSLYDQYRFSGEQGQFASIFLESDDFDSYLILLDPQGQRISENDDISRTNRNSRLVVTLPETGVYTAVANSYSAGKTGNYSIDIAVESTQIGLLEILAAASVPESSQRCQSAIIDAVNAIKSDRDVDVLVSSLQLNRLYSTVPTSRPDGVTIALTGSESNVVMDSSRFLKRLTEEVVTDCVSVGAVVFGTNMNGADRTFGVVSTNQLSDPPSENAASQRSRGIIPVLEFDCVALPDESESYDWGQQACS